MEEKRCLLLVGSPKGLKSTSYKLGEYFIDKLSDSGFEGKKFLLKDISKLNAQSSEGKFVQEITSFLDDVRESDLIIFSAPLYYDTIPSIAIETMEIIVDEYQKRSSEKEQQFLAIVNCGFPESSHCDTALKICQQFAGEIECEWLGGIKVGAGAAVGYQPLEGNKGMLKNFVIGLDMAVDAVAAGQEISDDAMEFLNKSLTSKLMYTTVLNWGWWFQARKYKAHKKLRDRPYLDK